MPTPGGFDPNAGASSSVPSGTLSSSQAAAAYGLPTQALRLQVPLKGTKKTASIQSLLDQFGGADTNSIKQLQELLYQGHYYPNSYYSKTNPRAPIFGAISDDDNKAYAAALRAAARTHQTFDEVLGQVITQTGNGTGPTSAASFTGTDLAEVADQTAHTLYGRRLTPSELDKLVSGFNALAPTDPNLTASAYAYSALRANNPKEAMGQDTRNSMNDFFSALGPAVQTGNNG